MSRGRTLTRSWFAPLSAAGIEGRRGAADGGRLRAWHGPSWDAVGTCCTTSLENGWEERVGPSRASLWKHRVRVPFEIVACSPCASPVVLLRVERDSGGSSWGHQYSCESIGRPNHVINANLGGCKRVEVCARAPFVIFVCASQLRSVSGRRCAHFLFAPSPSRAHSSPPHLRSNSQPAAL